MRLHSLANETEEEEFVGSRGLDFFFPLVPSYSFSLFIPLVEINLEENFFRSRISRLNEFYAFTSPPLFRLAHSTCSPELVILCILQNRP